MSQFSPVRSPDSTTSVTASTPKFAEVPAGAMASDTFDYNNSESTSTLQTSATSQSGTAGVNIFKDSFFIGKTATYNYSANSFIFAMSSSWVIIPLATSRSINAWLIMISIFKASRRGMISFGFTLFALFVV